MGAMWGVPRDTMSIVLVDGSLDNDVWGLASVLSLKEVTSYTSHLCNPTVLLASHRSYSHDHIRPTPHAPDASGQA